MTVADLFERMDAMEFREWMAYYLLEAEEMRDRESEMRAQAAAARNFRG